MKHKKEIYFPKISLKDKLRWLFLGKLPLERKYKPKIVEYLFMLFSSIIIFICELILLIAIINILNTKSENSFWVSFITKIKEFNFRIIITILIITYVVEIFLSLHIFYILSKTEFNKWTGIIAAISALLFLSPISFIFTIMAYQKNDLAFE
ncbi:hypothetical protein [Mycoplasma sp. 1654_15]|uniref:hypothetical protein n=1 Tax=Mycoplasma sp. 1654_15 TaxID=2725994 RepID=UPI0014499958|nr:hypothetical protein [Mycoplasma sp. 1654_15]QJB71442.1 hypothetical protein HF996_03140 [Mycoplasma sp. 1654_15]